MTLLSLTFLASASSRLPVSFFRLKDYTSYRPPSFLQGFLVFPSLVTTFGHGWGGSEYWCFGHDPPHPTSAERLAQAVLPGPSSHQHHPGKDPVCTRCALWTFIQASTSSGMSSVSPERSSACSGMSSACVVLSWCSTLASVVWGRRGSVKIWPLAVPSWAP